MELGKALGAICRELELNFTLNERSLHYDEIFSETGLLPALAKRADQLCSLCLGYGIGVSFEEAEKATVGKRVIFDDVTPNLLRYLCITDVLCELKRSSGSRLSVPLDELLYD